MPYSPKQRRTYSLSPSNTTKTPQRMLSGIGRPSRSREDSTSTCPLQFRCPPSLLGLQIEGMLVNELGGYSSPSGGAASPVALHTAAHSMAGFDPSRNE